MTPQERIAQIAAQRGVSIPTRRTAPRRDRPRTVATESAPSDPLACRSLPEAWRSIPDDWQHREQRVTAQELELRIAAWAIARLIGVDWRYEQTHPEYRSRFNIVHRDGYGFDLSRVWNNVDRFRITPMHRYRTDEGPPAEITVSASRTFGSIAAEIQRRMIDAGLRDAYGRVIGTRTENREELARRFAVLEAIAKSAGGRISNPRGWKSDAYPEAVIPGGRAAWGYGFSGDRVEFDLRATPKQAVEIAQQIAAIIGPCDK